MSETRPGLYGTLPGGLVDDPPEPNTQFSPTMPGAETLEDVPAGSLPGFWLLAPPGTLERRAALALALRATAAGAALVALAPKDSGGSRLRAELESFGCTVEESGRRHHRICQTVRPGEPIGLDAAIAAGAPRVVAAIGLVSQPGIFSWDRVDPGSALLADQMGGLAGRGADLGCGNGWLARRALATPAITHLTLVDIDRRAIACARQNVAGDPRAAFAWADLRHAASARAAALDRLDFVVMNPPFHAGGAEDRGLGMAFIRVAAGALRRGGTCWLVANRHLPYEKVLGEAFATVEPGPESGGFKLFRARK